MAKRKRILSKSSFFLLLSTNEEDTTKNNDHERKIPSAIRMKYVMHLPAYRFLSLIRTRANPKDVGKTHAGYSIVFYYWFDESKVLSLVMCFNPSFIIFNMHISLGFLFGQLKTNNDTVNQQTQTITKKAVDFT